MRSGSDVDSDWWTSFIAPLWRFCASGAVYKCDDLLTYLSSGCERRVKAWCRSVQFSHKSNTDRLGWLTWRRVVQMISGAVPRRRCQRSRETRPDHETAAEWWWQRPATPLTSAVEWIRRLWLTARVCRPAHHPAVRPGTAGLAAPRRYLPTSSRSSSNNKNKLGSFAIGQQIAQRSFTAGVRWVCAWQIYVGGGGGGGGFPSLYIFRVVSFVVVRAEKFLVLHRSRLAGVLSGARVVSQRTVCQYDWWHVRSAVLIQDPLGFTYLLLLASSFTEWLQQVLILWCNVYAEGKFSHVSRTNLAAIYRVFLRVWLCVKFSLAFRNAQIVGTAAPSM